MTTIDYAEHESAPSAGAPYPPPDGEGGGDDGKGWGKGGKPR